MYQTIHEKVAVAGVFDQGKFWPKKMRWGNKNLAVEQVTFVAETKDGGVHWRQYSLLADGNLYRLAFQRDAETWWLEEVWCEG